MAVFATKGMLYAAIVALICFKYARAFMRTVRMFWKARHIPGPRGYPPIGSFLRFAGPLDQLVQKTIDVQREYGDTVRVWAGSAINIVIADPKDIEVALSNPLLQTKPPVIYNSLSPILGVGIVSLNGEEHRRHRKAMTPSLHLDVLRDFVPTFERNALLMCMSVDKFAETGEVFDAMPLLGSYSTHSVCETVFSTEFPGLEEQKKVYIKYLVIASELMFHRSIRPWYNVDFFFKFSSSYKEYMNASRVYKDFATKMLEYKKDQLRQGKGESDRKRKAFLDHILTSTEGNVLREEELLHELQTLSIAAVGTSMDFMSFFLTCIAMHPDVQDRIHQELDDVFGDSDRSLELSDLSHLQYMECAMKETLRLFPSVFVFSRNVTQDLELPSGYVIPEGSILGFIPIITHRNPEVFPEPYKFDPNRFLPENTRGRNPFAFIPFSAGSRNCIGQRYAMMSAKVLGATLFRRFRFLPSDETPTKVQDVKIMAGISITPANGAKLRVERR